MVFAPCLFSLSDAMEMLAISHPALAGAHSSSSAVAGTGPATSGTSGGFGPPLGGGQQHAQPVGAGGGGVVCVACGGVGSAGEMIDLPLAKRLCTQTQDVVVALISDCERIFAPVESERSVTFFFSSFPSSFIFARIKKEKFRAIVLS
jgi:hypothetical protein